MNHFVNNILYVFGDEKKRVWLRDTINAFETSKKKVKETICVEQKESLLRVLLWKSNAREEKKILSLGLR